VGVSHFGLKLLAITRKPLPFGGGSDSIEKFFRSRVTVTVYGLYGNVISLFIFPFSSYIVSQSGCSLPPFK
jgi:hypothetical protein